MVGLSIKSKNTREILFVAALLEISLIIVFFPIIFGDKTLLVANNKSGGMVAEGSFGYPKDKITNLNLIDPAAVSWQFQPLFRLVENMYANKTLPLWNPYSGTGSPLAADMQSSAFFPPLILLSFFSGWQTNLDHYFLFRLFIAGIFTYLLCRRLKLGFWSSMLASHLIMFNGYFMGYINQAHINVEMLLPAALWAVESFIQNNKRLYLFGFSGIIFLLITGGMPESAFLAFLFILGYGAVRLLENISRFEIRNRLKTFINIVVSFFAGIGAASFLIVPFLEFLVNSAHYHTLNDLPGAWWIDLRTLGTYFIPKLLPRSQEMINSWFFSGEVAMGTFSIIGFLLLPLIFYNLKAKIYLKFFLLAWIIIIIGKIFNLPGFVWLGNLPILNQIVLVKFPLIELSMALALVCAFGWEGLGKTKSSKPVYLLVLSGLMLILLMTGFGIFYAKTAGNSGIDVQYINSYIRSEVFFVLITILGCITFTFYRLYFSLQKMTYMISSLSIILFIVVLTIHNTKGGWQNKYDPFTKPDFLQKITTDSRIMGINALHPNLTVPLGISNLRSNNALYPKNYTDFMENIIVTDPPFDLLASNNKYNLNSTGLDFLNLKYLVINRDEKIAIPKKYNLAGRYGTYELYKNSKVLSRATFFNSFVVLDDKKAIEAMKKGKLDPSKVVVLDQNPNLPESERSINYKISTLTSNPLYHKFKVQTDSPGIFVLSDTFYPGWTSKVNGKNAKILQVNNLVRGVVLEKDSNTVEFIYRPLSWIVGSILSLLFFLIFISYLKYSKKLFHS